MAIRAPDGANKSVSMREWNIGQSLVDGDVLGVMVLKVQYVEMVWGWWCWW